MRDSRGAGTCSGGEALRSKDSKFFLVFWFLFSLGNSRLRNLLAENKELKMLLSTQQERLDANKKNRTVILEFLCCHRYSTLQNIAYELGHKSTATASRVLKRLCAERLVKKEVFKDDVFNVTLFGITKNGVGFLDRDIEENLHFIPSRVSLRNLNHTLINQRVGTFSSRLYSESFNTKIINTEFGNLKKYEEYAMFKHRPDLILSLKKDVYEKMILIETELSIKDKKRYLKIWNEYLLLKSKGKLLYVMYFVKNNTAYERLGEIRNRLKFNLLSLHDDKNLLEETIRIVNIEKQRGLCV
uniref:Uncharacterized protein n=4 Tax=Vibrio TaxID=662 RepID=A0A0H3ZMC1_9VIBR|nr:hypothetical protein [Vibrio sp. ZF_53]AKN37413.1 hypothetical protein [Vibrio tasmaniensis]AKN39333.1 hypothetical protein [Vibrio sp. ZF_45]AKN39741.1 hypothetical protein [Vibrio splendidus]